MTQTYSDPALAQRMKRREVPNAPIDMLAVKGDGPSAETARAALRTLHETWTLISDAAKNTEVELSELTKVGDRALKRGLKAMDNAHETVRKQIAFTDGKIRDVVQPTISPQMAAEIRSLVRSDPAKALLMVREDPRISSAVLSGPASLSGVTQDEQERLKAAAIAAHAPELGAQKHEAELALSLMERMGSHATAVLASKLHSWGNAQPTQMDALRKAAAA
ncbi:MAG: hypothetical protein AAF607_00715 [Pseudomonadota bacterium]